MSQPGLPTIVRRGLKSLLWRVRAKLKLRSLLILKSLGVLPRLNLRVPIAQEGSLIRIPLLAGAGMQNILMTERWMTDLLRTLLHNRPDGVFIDVGVNVGQTLIKLKRLRPTQAYLGFEPNPSCLHYLSELFRLNDFGNAHVLPVGLDGATGLKELVYYDAEDAVSSSATLRGEAFRPHSKVAGRRIVPLMPFEAATQGFLDAPISIVKIDVEGAEEYVLETLSSTLERTRVPVIVEILPEPSAIANEAKNQRLSVLVGRIGYRIHRVIKRKEDYVGLISVADIGPNQDVDGWDYVLLPIELDPEHR